MASYSYERDITPEDLIQETPPPLTPAQQRANWWHYHWYYVDFSGCVRVGAPCFCFVLNLLTHGSRSHSSNISPVRHSGSVQHTPAGHCR